MVSCLEVPGVPQSLTLVSTPSTTPPPPASSGHHLVLSLEPPAPRCCRSIKSQSKLHLLGETFPNGFAKSPPELCPYILSPQHFPLYGLISSVSCLLREHCDARSPLQRPACLSASQDRGPSAEPSLSRHLLRELRRLGEEGRERGGSGTPKATCCVCQGQLCTF